MCIGCRSKTTSTSVASALVQLRKLEKRRFFWSHSSPLKNIFGHDKRGRSFAEKMMIHWPALHLHLKDFPEVLHWPSFAQGFLSHGSTGCSHRLPWKFVFQTFSTYKGIHRLWNLNCCVSDISQIFLEGKPCTYIISLSTFAFVRWRWVWCLKLACSTIHARIALTSVDSAFTVWTLIARWTLASKNVTHENLVVGIVSEQWRLSSSFGKNPKEKFPSHPHDNKTYPCWGDECFHWTRISLTSKLTSKILLVRAVLAGQTLPSVETRIFLALVQSLFTDFAMKTFRTLAPEGNENTWQCLEYSLVIVQHNMKVLSAKTPNGRWFLCVARK